MRIHFSNVDFSSRSGPNTFGYRLAEELSLRRHEIVSANSVYDVALVFIEPSTRLRDDAKIIQRLDGIWFKPEQFVSHNKLIKETYKKCHHVVWQSEFDKNMTTHHWGDRSGTVIRNGVALRGASPIKREGFLESDNIFVTSSNWHLQKRLKANIEFFRSLKIYNSRLIVMGKCGPADLDEKSLGEDIAFMGDVDHETCMRIYSIADWMIHLAWLDHCPNVVVEALSQGCKVICASSGGTHELINETRGFVLPETFEYKYELTDYDSPPELDFSNVKLPMLNRDFDKSDLDIKLVASKYEKIFLGV
jgi:glycosyltransferase involved in cell wall biosynthesis